MWRFGGTLRRGDDATRALDRKVLAPKMKRFKNFFTLLLCADRFAINKFWKRYKSWWRKGRA